MLLTWIQAEWKKKIINLSKTSAWGEHQLFNVYIYIKAVRFKVNKKKKK
jgi:hypothetical protein